MTKSNDLSIAVLLSVNGLLKRLPKNVPSFVDFAQKYYCQISRRTFIRFVSISQGNLRKRCKCILFFYFFLE